MQLARLYCPGSCILRARGQSRKRGQTKVGPVTSEKALTYDLAPFCSAPDRNHVPPAADPTHIARLAAGGILDRKAQQCREGRSKKEECRMQPPVSTRCATNTPAPSNPPSPSPPKP